MKQIHVLRHAKSSWDDSSRADHDRPLAARGLKASARIATYVHERGFEPQLVLCSTARRARQTLEGIGGALGDGADIRFEDELYLATAGELTSRLKEVDAGVSSVMLIGHNPGLHDLLLELAGSGEDLARVRAKFPTAALATLAFEGRWSDLAAAGARLVDYVVPKDLE